MYKHQLVAQHDHLGAVLQHHDPHEQHVRVPIRGALCARTAANRTFGHTTPALASSTTPSRSTLGVPSPCSAPRPDTSRWAAPWLGSQMSQREEQDAAMVGRAAGALTWPSPTALPVQSPTGCLGYHPRYRRWRQRRRRCPGWRPCGHRAVGSPPTYWLLCGQRADWRTCGYTRHEEAASCRRERGQSSRTPLLSCRHSWRAYYRVLATCYGSQRWTCGCVVLVGHGR